MIKLYTGLSTCDAHSIKWEYKSHSQSMAIPMKITKLVKNVKNTQNCDECLMYKLYMIISS